MDPKLVAVGGGDSTIRVWKTASSQPGFDVSLVWQKLSSKLSVILNFSQIMNSSVHVYMYHGHPVLFLLKFFS